MQTAKSAHRAGRGGTATHSFLITDSTPPTTALTCVGSLTDQYNEPPVAFTVNVAATTVAMKTWPAMLAVGANGAQVAATSATTGAMAIAFVPTISPAVAFARNLNTWLGGGIAEATICAMCPHGTPPPSPKPSPTPSPKPTVAPTVAPTSAPTSTPGSGITFLGGPCYAYAKNGAGGVDTTLTNGEIQIGTRYYTAASDGCINVAPSPTGPFAPATSAQVGIIAYEPGDTSASTPTYIPNAGVCTGKVSLGQPYPLNSSGIPTGPQVLVPVIPGSTTGSCSVTISDGSTSAPIADAGLANVQVGAYPCDFIGGSCTTAPPTTSVGGTCGPYNSGGSSTSINYTFSSSQTAMRAIPSTTGTITINPDMSKTFTRAGPGLVYELRLSRFPGHLDRAGEYPANEVSWKRRIGPIAKNSRKTRFAA